MRQNNNDESNESIMANYRQFAALLFNLAFPWTHKCASTLNLKFNQFVHVFLFFWDSIRLFISILGISVFCPLVRIVKTQWLDSVQLYSLFPWIGGNSSIAGECIVCALRENGSLFYLYQFVECHRTIGTFSIENVYQTNPIEFVAFFSRKLWVTQTKCNSKIYYSS